jgi:hypothetical protein
LTKQGIAAEEIAKEVQKTAKGRADLVVYIGKTEVLA